MNTVDKMINNALKKSGQEKLVVNYQLENALDDTICHQKVQFVNDYGDEDIKSRVIENPTYMDLALFVNEQIINSGDDQHVFLEDIYPLNVENENTENEIHLYSYALGS